MSTSNGSQYEIDGKTHYERNKDYYIQRNRERIKKIHAYVVEKKQEPCMDCGQSYPYCVMQYDHRPNEQKEFNISWAVAQGYSIERIQKEIDKCDLVCANCHAIRTFQRSGYA